MSNNEHIDLIQYIDNFKNNTDSDNLLWKIDNIEKYNKFTQYINNKEKIEINKEEIKTIKEEIKTNNKDKKIIKSKKILPLNLICSYSNLIDTENNIKQVKEKLTNIITNQNYIKVFGRKVSAEILKNLVENKWNKSLVIFVSFLFDIKIIYLKKEILFNKELENYKTIMI